MWSISFFFLIDAQEDQQMLRILANDYGFLCTHWCRDKRKEICFHSFSLLQEYTFEHCSQQNISVVSSTLYTFPQCINYIWHQGLWKGAWKFWGAWSYVLIAFVPRSNLTRAVSVDLRSSYGSIVKQRQEESATKKKISNNISL